MLGFRYGKLILDLWLRATFILYSDPSSHAPVGLTWPGLTVASYYRLTGSEWRLVPVSKSQRLLTVRKNLCNSDSRLLLTYRVTLTPAVSPVAECWNHCNSRVCLTKPHWRRTKEDTSKVQAIAVFTSTHKVGLLYILVLMVSALWLDVVVYCIP